MKVEALAHPEKRLFISLLTRDISLVDAFLDLVDNSVNAALKSANFIGDTSADYIRLLNAPTQPRYNIYITFDDDTVTVKDNCGGISAESAQNSIFVFGAASQDSHDDDRLSVYGIGLKRAMFKLGNKIDMTSDHAEGGFSLDLNVPDWENDHRQPWRFDIDTRPPSDAGATALRVTQLHPSVVSRLRNPTFLSDLRIRIGRAYSFFISRVVRIFVNGDSVGAEEAQVSSHKATESFDLEGVSVAITAGLGAPKNGRYASETAGWNIYCNGRAVIVFDKSPLTGWGVDGYLPSFQPKHRPFVGIVFFTSDNPELLPWTTTKLGVNPDNIVWQRALQRMADVGRQVTGFLDNRYGEDGTSISMDDLAMAVGPAERVVPAISNRPVTFVQPKPRIVKDPSVQFTVDRRKLAAVKEAIGRPSMSNGDAGKYTFDYFYDNEVDNA
jgi:hypothetical protein